MRLGGRARARASLAAQARRRRRCGASNNFRRTQAARRAAIAGAGSCIRRTKSDARVHFGFCARPSPRAARRASRARRAMDAGRRTATRRSTSAPSLASRRASTWRARYPVARARAAVFAFFDSDGSGTIAYDEFLHARCAASSTRGAPALVLRAFRKLDRSGDGVIAIDALVAHTARRATRASRRAGSAMAVLREFLEVFARAAATFEYFPFERFVERAARRLGHDHDADYFELLLPESSRGRGATQSRRGGRRGRRGSRRRARENRRALFARAPTIVAFFANHRVEEFFFATPSSARAAASRAAEFQDSDERSTARRAPRRANASTRSRCASDAARAARVPHYFRGPGGGASTVEHGPRRAAAAAVARRPRLTSARRDERSVSSSSRADDDLRARRVEGIRDMAARRGRRRSATTTSPHGQRRACRKRAALRARAGAQIAAPRARWSRCISAAGIWASAVALLGEHCRARHVETRGREAAPSSFAAGRGNRAQEEPAYRRRRRNSPCHNPRMRWPAEPSVVMTRLRSTTCVPIVVRRARARATLSAVDANEFGSGSDAYLLAGSRRSSRRLHAAAARLAAPILPTSWRLLGRAHRRGRAERARADELEEARARRLRATSFLPISPVLLKKLTLLRVRESEPPRARRRS